MILIVWLPIAFHGLYGLLAIKAARPNVGRFRYMDNLRYLLQRVSGIGLLLFIPAHVYKTRLEPYFSGHPLDFGHMVEGFMGDPLTLPVYILGVTGACYHLANGIWQFSIGWGISQTEGGMRRVLAFSVVVGLVLLAMAYAAIYGFMRT
jgi:succinate dehydrogenase / fumarate reductase cytochrome b subunit